MDELMGIALAMEREAALRYVHLAEAMDRRTEPELAALFRRLACLERDHQTGLERWAEREGRTRPVPVQVPWRLPETFDDSADGTAAHTLTPYAALAMAVVNEERAFTFYTYLAAMAPDADMRRRAEALAREELTHVRLLRTMRRQAFHTDRHTPRVAHLPRDAGQLAVVANSLEITSAGVDEAAARCLAAAGWPEGAAELTRLAMAARERAGRYAATPPPVPPRGDAWPEGGRLDSAAALRLSLRNAEQVAATYVAAAGEATDEATLSAAQTLAAEAVARLAAVSALMEEQERRPR